MSTPEHEALAARLLDGLGNAATALGPFFGGPAALAAGLVATAAHATAEGFRAKGAALTIEHIRLPPPTIGDWKHRK